jgi:hypothetical protein
MTGEQGREAAFLAEVAALTRRYRERLSGFTAQAQTLARELEKGRDPAVHRELRRLLHSLAGTAPTYGFPGTGRAARAAMALLDGEGGAPRFPDPGVLDGALKALRSAVENEEQAA